MNVASSAEDLLVGRIEALEALAAIQKLVGHYALAADRRNDPAVFAPLLSTDAVWEAEGFGRYEGREQIVEALSKIGQEKISWTIHYMISPIIDLDPCLKNARCRWYLWELSTIVGNGGESADHWLGGWYDARVRREDGQWFFSHIVLDLRLISEAVPQWTGKKPFQSESTFGRP